MAPHDPKKLRIRRLLLLLALLGVFVALGVTGWLISGSETIQRGMTRDEVAARLGPPNGRMLAVDGKAINDVVLVWKDRGIVIEFDADDRVRMVSWPPSLFDSLRNMFRF